MQTAFGVTADHPSRVALVTSPSRQLLPHVLRLMVHPPDRVGMTELLELCDAPVTPPMALPSVGTGLTYALFASPQLNVLRVKYALAFWCSVCLLDCTSPAILSLTVSVCTHRQRRNSTPVHWRS